MNSASFLRTEQPAECEKHGAFVAVIFGGRGRLCPKCTDEARALEDARHEELAKAERLATALDRAGLRGRFRSTTLESFEADTPAKVKVRDGCRTFVRAFEPGTGGGLWLLGRVGTGKSHLGAAMAHACIAQRGIGALLISARDVVRQMRATWHQDPQGSRDPFSEDVTEQGLINRFARVPLLILDEVGVGFGTEAEQVQLLDVIDLRYQLRGATVLLSNLSAPLIRDAVGERLFDRLREGSTTHVLDWPSHRQGASA